MQVWIVGRQGEPWEVQGVFSTERKASLACTRTEDFIGPITLDEIAPQEPTEWKGAYYPNVESQ